MNASYETTVARRLQRAHRVPPRYYIEYIERARDVNGGKHDDYMPDMFPLELHDVRVYAVKEYQEPGI